MMFELCITPANRAVLTFSNCAAKGGSAMRSYPTAEFKAMFMARVAVKSAASSVAAPDSQALPATG